MVHWVNGFIPLVGIRFKCLRLSISWVGGLEVDFGVSLGSSLVIGILQKLVSLVSPRIAMVWLLCLHDLIIIVP